MTELVESVQKQAVDSPIVVLYDLAYATDSAGNDSYARFFPSGLDGDLDEVQFRDSSGVARTYVALPMQIDGIQVNADGAYNRPELSIANIESVFSDAIGGLSFEKLSGKRITRRTTLKKYLVGESGDSGAGNAPVEFPKATFIIDRLKARSPTSVTFELAAPFDLAGIQLPRRVVIGGSCPWKYTGASQVKYDSDNLIFTTAKERDWEGGCTWRRDSKIYDSYNGTEYTLYMTGEDEYIVPSSISFTDASGLSSFTANAYYKTTGNAAIQINNDSSTTSTTVTEYWQCVSSTSTSPTRSSAAWRRVRIYYTYSASTTYYGYKDKSLNDYVVKDYRLWRIQRNTQTASNHNTVEEGDFWTQGDVCGKTLTSCAMRFQAKVQSDGDGGWDRLRDSRIGLPYGGYPGIAQRR